MSIPESLYSIRAESNFLGSLIKNPKILIEAENFILERDFFHKTHRTLYSVLRNLILSGQNADKVILAQKCKELGLNNFEDLNLFEYVDSISFVSLNERGTLDLGRELQKLRIKRELWDNASEVQNFIKESGEKSLDELIFGVDGIYNNQISQYSIQIEPTDLYANIEDFLINISKNPVEEVGFKTPYPEWNRLFGGIRTKQTTNIISRSGEGKSAFLFNMAKNIAKLNNIKILYIDSEMDLDLNMFRAAAAEMNLNAWYLETGQWTKSKELSEKAVNGFKKLNEYRGSIHHIYLPNKPIKETITLMKRWYYKNVGRGNRCAFVYDYLKITDVPDKNRAEYQALGDMLNYLNELGHETDSAILTAGQQNRAAENQGIRNDDSTTAAVSDRINHLVGFNAVFRKKTDDELTEFGNKYGSHLLKPFKTSRVQGKENYNMNSAVKTIDHAGKIKWKQNFINYTIENYKVIELGTLQDIIKDQSLSHTLQKEKPENKELTI